MNIETVEFQYQIARQALNRRQFSEAESRIRKMLKSRAGDPHLLVLLGIALLEQGKIDDAIQALKKATRRKSGSPESHFNLGLALTKSGDFAGAAQAFEAVLAIEPKDVEAPAGGGGADPAMRP
jgi:Flp pilus assembly protein TadD